MVFYFLEQREETMPSPVQSPSVPSPGDNRLLLSELILKDLELIPRKKTAPILSILRGSRELRFYIRADEVSCPIELAEREFRDIKESAVHLPATDQSVHEVTRIFERFNDRYLFSRPIIRHCFNGDVIFYTVSPLD